jgi:Uncharacterized membrane-anchored protein conserved in bacteria
VSRLTQNRTKEILLKVPEITLVFWIIKILTTGMGEVFSDFLVLQINPVIGVGIGFTGFITALFLQFHAKRYIPWIYWLTVVMVSVFGTMVADVLHIEMGISYTASTVICIVLLAVIFILWKRTENTLSIHSINTRRREIFYWATVLATFSLGTATGDLTATTWQLGYFESGILFAVLIAIPFIAWRYFRMDSIFAFWFAYILTRPLGASFADWISVPAARGGLDFGTGTVSLILSAVIAMLVLWLQLRYRHKQSFHEPSKIEHSTYMDPTHKQVH